MNEIIQIQHLQKHFGNLKVLNDVSFDIHKGEVVTIIGSSGSGKSTMLRCINLLERMDGGDILYHGKNILDNGNDVNQYRSKVGMVFQSFNLFNNLSVIENCMIGQIKVLKRSKEEARAKAEKYLKEVGMFEFANKASTKLSGGQKQRLCIARALLKHPKILILDDSTSAVDTATDASIQESFNERIPDTTKIIISQRISSVQNASRIIVLNDGVVDGFDTHENLLETNEIYRTIYETQMKGKEEK